MELNSKLSFVLKCLQYYIKYSVVTRNLEEFEKRLYTRYFEISEKVYLTIMMEFPAA
jgi:hypothetical protein